MYKLHRVYASRSTEASQRTQTDLPATEARERISEVISRVAYGGERIVLSRNGRPQVAVVSLADLERLKRMDPELERSRQRAIEALAEIRAAAERDGTDQLTAEEIDAEIAAVRKNRKSVPKRAAK